MSSPFPRVGFRRLPLSWLVAVLAVLGLAGSHAQSSRPARDFVWKVTGPRSSLYLAGSLHEMRARDRPPLSLYQAYALADRVVFEADIAEFDRPPFRDRVSQLSTLPPGENLTNRLDGRTIARLAGIALRNDLPADTFERFRPWFAGTYAALLLLSEAGFKEEHGIDRYFYDRAVKERKTLAFLETGAEQLELLSRIPEAEAIESLRQDLDGGVDYARSLVDAWSEGDARAFDRLSRDNSTNAPVSFQRFVADRNRAWIPRLTSWLQDTNTTLVIVGAGHLVGTNGLVHLLVQGGHTVRQLP